MAAHPLPAANALLQRDAARLLAELFDAEGLETELDRRAGAEALRRALGELSPQQRQGVVLREVHGFPRNCPPGEPVPTNEEEPAPEEEFPTQEPVLDEAPADEEFLPAEEAPAEEAPAEEPPPEG